MRNKEESLTGKWKRKDMQRSMPNMSGEKKENRYSNIGIYAVGAIALAVLILTAFFAPSLVFGLQDKLRCQEEKFEIQETQDITLLSTSYEQSLYKRFLRFAEDKQSGAQMYVTARELTPNQELENFLQSEKGLFQEGILLLADIGVLPYELFEEKQYQTTDWKQYVIYNENYDLGVNFIIWYIQLETSNGFVYRMLMDAQTGSLYGMQFDNSAWLEKQEKKKEIDSVKLSDIMGISLISELDRMDAWTGLAYYYGGYQENDTFLKEMEEYYENIAVDGYIEEPNKGETVISWSDEYVSKRVTDDEIWYNFSFPYEEYKLDFRIRQDSAVFVVEKAYSAVVDITMGFPDIYELIPEFKE